jgi:hypothetical protein
LSDTIRIKRRTSGAAGAPSSLANAELAYNEVGDVLYYGKGDDGAGVATSVVPVGGSGAFARTSDLAGYQPLDADLTSLAAASAVGVIYYRSASNTWATVTIGTGLTFSGGTISATSAGGNVSNVGTPANGQLAQWTDATHIQGVAASSLGFAPLASPVFTGDPRSVTPITSDNDTSIATTAYVKAQGYEVAANKGVANGYASLDATTKVPAAQLPSYVDDVVEYANAASFPATGAAGIIYVALDTNKIYRWSGSVYVEISPSPGSTDAVPEGSVNLYYTEARVSANATVASKAPTASPVFTGDPRAPTPTAGDADTSIATTAFVASAISTAGGTYQPLDADLTSLAGASATGAIYYRSAANTWGPITVGGNLTFAGGTLNAAVGTSDLASYAPLASPTFTGDPKAPTPATADNDTSVATTAFVQSNLASYQPLDADLTAIAALTGTNVIYYRSAANTWAAVTIGAGLTFTAGTLDAPVFTSSVKGEVPASGGGTANFLRADGTWAAPAGGGGGIPEPVGDGFYGRSMASSIGSWIVAVKKAGDVMTGDLTISTGTSSQFILNKAVGGNANRLVGRTNNLQRWQLALGNTAAESGANAGSDFVLSSFADDGSTGTAIPLTITRATGLATVWGDPTAALGIATKQYADTKGNVSNSGTPNANDVAQWVTSTTIKGVPLDTWRTAANFFGTTTVRNNTGGDGLNFAGSAGQGLISAQGNTADIGLLISSKGNAAITFYAANFGRVAAQFQTAAGSNTFLQVIGNVGFSTLVNNPAANPLYISSPTNLLGVTDGSNAQAGYVGEFFSASFSAVAISAASIVNMTSLSLTAGDWDVWLSIDAIVNATATQAYAIMSMSTTSGTNDFTAGRSARQVVMPNNFPASVCPMSRFNLTTTTTVYAVGQAVSANLSVNGTLMARRRR